MFQDYGYQRHLSEVSELVLNTDHFSKYIPKFGSVIKDGKAENMGTVSTMVE